MRMEQQALNILDNCNLWYKILMITGKNQNEIMLNIILLNVDSLLSLDQCETNISYKWQWQILIKAISILSKKCLF